MNRRISLVPFLLIALLVFSFSLAQAAQNEPTGGAAEDRVITKNVYSALAKEFKADFTESPDFTVKTFQGVVILGGSADEESTIKKAGEVVSKVSGVKSVENHMSIRSTY